MDAAIAKPVDPPVFADGALTEEVEAALWLQHQLREGRPLAVSEARIIRDAIRDAVLRCDGGIPQARIDDVSEFLGVHAVNVSALAMALAGYVRFDEAAVREIGLAGLLHDVGMLRLPPDLLVKPGQLTGEERRRIKEHPSLGATVIIEADAALDLAAVVAYEHHVKLDGSGYPIFRYPRAVHYVSRLIQVCDVFHALRSPRPFRKPWPVEFILSFLNERAGFEFHPALVRALTRMIEGSSPPPLDSVFLEE